MTYTEPPPVDSNSYTRSTDRNYRRLNRAPNLNRYPDTCRFTKVLIYRAENCPMRPVITCVVKLLRTLLLNSENGAKGWPDHMGPGPRQILVHIIFGAFGFRIRLL